MSTATTPIASIEGVAFVERLDGAEADPEASPALLVEVPHGADRRAHYDALRARLIGDLPDDLHLFFHANTDMGAWQLGRRVAERVIAALPDKSALLVRCLIPRTFVDANRLAEAQDEIGTGGLTAGVAPYVRDEADRALLLSLHRAYVALAERAYPLVCDSGGFALIPHTYGPRTMGIAKIDDHIVEALRAAAEPAAWEGWPLRPEVDLITREADGTHHAPAAMAEAVLAAYRALGVDAHDNQTYHLHPSTQGYRWSTRYPQSTLCLEVRRDLLVDAFSLFEELEPTASRVDRMALPLAEVIADRLARQSPARTFGAMDSTIRETFGSEHARLDQTLGRLLDSVEGADRARLVADWRAFEESLLHHFEREEKILFPGLLDTQTEAVAQARGEHAEIRALLDELGTAVELHTLRQEVAERFVALLKAHAAFEDAAIYGAADEQLGPEDRARAIDHAD